MGHRQTATTWRLMPEILLGAMYCDKLSGIEGRAIALHQYWGSDCRATLLRIDREGKQVETTFDVSRLERIKESDYIPDPHSPNGH